MSIWHFRAMTAVLGLGGILVTADGLAVEIEGVTLAPESVYSEQRLELAGCGTREMMFFVDVYVISLYLPAPPADAVMDPATTKLVQLNIIYDGSVPDDLPDEWRSRLEDQISEEMLRTLQGFYKDIRGGDIVTIGYAPDSGTAIRVNGDAVVTQPGNSLIDAMLELWIGEDPISGNLKRLLLQTPCS
ncbi:chalcone isomerase family protein [Inquilinus sp. CAU 1745]|uniref:chalcone isomerase family protein n=1 Tax=Inquilinus sp. CAU 1745 TaxID=3140369 RepID=UPI00325B107B